MSIRSISLRVLVPALLALAAAPLAATSYVMVSDEALVDGAPAAAVVRVVSVDRAVAQRTGGRPVTEYRVQVEEALKGEIPGGTAVVQIPGGIARNGMALKVYGAPRLQKGERALLFLDPEADGAWRVAHLLLGSFREIEDGGRRFAVRSLSGARELKVTAEGIEEGSGRDRLRDFDAFARWVADRAQGIRREADYLVPEDEARRKRITEKFTLFEDPLDFKNMRWFNFDTVGNVKWSAYKNGQGGVTGGGYAQFQTALQAWNAESQTPVDYRYQGKTSNKTGLTDYDEVNTIVFNDPNSELPTFSCSSGGVLAYGGPWYDGRESALAFFRGQQYHPILNADIVINNGLSCFFAESPNGSKAAVELFAHELGHTLGLGHSCGDGDGPDPDCENALFDDALMRAFIHDDARGGRLNADDEAGVRSLYKLNLTPAAPSNLTATADSTDSVDLAWTDNATNETGYEVEARTLTGDFEVAATLPANSTSATIGSLDSATGYVFRVKAVNASGPSGYSNEASVTTSAPVGPCVADAHTLCLNSGRFRVRVDWETSVGDTGQASAVPVLSDDSGLLWFFNESNWEMLVKVLNACTPPQPRYWVFFAATTNVEFVVTVTDTQTGQVKTYLNPQGKSADAITDTSAFATCP